METHIPLMKPSSQKSDLILIKPLDLTTSLLEMTPMVQQVKNPPAMQETQETRVRFWIRKIPGGGHGNPLQYSRLKNPMDRSLVGSSPQGHRDMTEGT